MRPEAQPANLAEAHSWLNPRMAVVKRVGFAVAVLWPAAGWLNERLVSTPWLQWTLFLGLAALCGYLAVMAWQALWRGTQRGLALALIGLAWLPVFGHLFVAWPGVGLNGLMLELRQVEQPSRDWQAVALDASVAVDKRDFAARLIYTNQGMRVGWRNANGEVRLFEPTANDDAAWQNLQTVRAEALSATDSMARANTNLRWLASSLCLCFGLTQLVLAVAVAWRRGRHGRCSVAEPA